MAAGAGRPAPAQPPQRGVPLDPVALRMAIDDAADSSPSMRSQAQCWLETLDRWEAEATALDEAIASGVSDVEGTATSRRRTVPRLAT